MYFFSKYLFIFRYLKRNVKLREMIIFDTSFFNQGSKAARAAGKICAFYGESTIAEGITRDWYAN